jgi:BMFP domain-containing protein YqiC
MQTENKFFEDFVKMANGFAGTVAGMGREAESNARERVKSFLGGMDFVSREEFEAVKAMAAAARDEVAALRAELAAAKDPGAAPTSYDAAPGEGGPAAKPRKK